MKEQGPIFLPYYKTFREEGFPVEESIDMAMITQEEIGLPLLPRQIPLENGKTVNIIYEGMVIHGKNES